MTDIPGVPMIRCNGPCGKTKEAFLFSPAEHRHGSPVCMECRSKYNKGRRNAKGPKDRAWRKNPCLVGAGERLKPVQDLDGKA